VGEFGIVLMIGGNIPGQTRVLSIAIFDHVEALEYGRAHVLAGGLLAFSLVAIFLLQRFSPLARRPEASPGPAPKRASAPPLAPDSAGEEAGEGAWLQAWLQLERAQFSLDLSFTLPARGVVALVGPSGSGKTTVLRSLAGLEPGARGRILAGGETWLDSKAGVNVPGHLRGTSLVFQDTRLFAHLDVRGNLEYASRRSEALRAGRTMPLDEVIALLGVAPLLGRGIDGLSRGEAQRVALARALLARPRLLLLDEPLSGLDGASRQELLPHLARTFERIDIPVVYVSHHAEEIEGIAVRTISLAGGRISAR
jgi:molybdate transport system ATP-binding protein